MKIKYLMALATSVAVLLSSCTKEGEGGGGTHKNHNYVDMGAAGKWATMNIGATTEFAAGDYYAWGEPEVKKTYLEDSYNDGSEDIAATLWGGEWRMPTIQEWRQLANTVNYKWTMEYLDEGVGIKGFYVESLSGPTAGNKIFLPAAGMRDKMVNGVVFVGQIGDQGTMCYYWSSSLMDSSNKAAYILYVGSTPLEQHPNTNIGMPCYYGLPVRPVLGK